MHCRRLARKWLARARCAMSVWCRKSRPKGAYILHQNGLLAYSSQMKSMSEISLTFHIHLKRARNGGLSGTPITTPDGRIGAWPPGCCGKFGNSRPPIDDVSCSQECQIFSGAKHPGQACLTVCRFPPSNKPIGSDVYAWLGCPSNNERQSDWPVSKETPKALPRLCCLRLR